MSRVSIGLLLPLLVVGKVEEGGRLVDVDGCAVSGRSKLDVTEDVRGRE